MMTTMTKTASIKISKRTLDILKNFSAINTGLLVPAGSVLNTLSASKNILAEARVNEVFKQPFAIWDLNKFLGTVSLFKEPEFVFEENYVTIQGTDSSVRYYYCDPRLVNTTSKKITMPKSVVSFELKQKDFAEIIKAASVLQAPHLCVRSSQCGENIEIAATDKVDPTSNFYAVVVGKNTSAATFDFVFDTDNLKILPGDYQVSISEKIVSQFTNKNEPLAYWIALNTESTYEA